VIQNGGTYLSGIQVVREKAALYEESRGFLKRNVVWKAYIA
jgi:hypothetical protein